MFVVRREATWFVYERTIYPASTVLSGREQAFSLARAQRQILDIFKMACVGYDIELVRVPLGGLLHPAGR